MKFTQILKNCTGEYKKHLILCPVAMIGEVAMETTIPLMTATLIDKAIPHSQETGEISQVLLYGGIMLAMALISMVFGFLGSYLSSKGALGFGRNLRQALFEKIQRFSFKNIDRFSTASLVTRLTTDVNQVQSVVMMLVRMAVRSPIMLQVIGMVLLMALMFLAFGNDIGRLIK